MKQIVFFLLINFFNLLLASSYAQKFNTTISGYIYDNDTPLFGVNVFLSETMLGTTTDNNGYFKIVNIPPGTYELVASMVGYKPDIQTIILKKNINFELKVLLNSQIYNLDEIEISADKDDDWEDNFETFKNVFLGKTLFTEKCNIENKYKIKLFVKDDILRASCKEPIIINNNALGYKIKCFLISFSYSFEDGFFRYLFKQYFIPIKNEQKKDEWNKNREIAYYGSEHHFFHSLIYKNLEKQGYIIRLSDSIDKLNPIGGEKITEDYIVKKIPNKGEYLISFNGYLYVIFSNKFQYLKNFSIIELPKKKMTLDEFAYPLDLISYTTHGYWADCGISNLLPKYYKIFNP